jgi:membrane protease YdiL (CAAX protease family)
METTAQVKKKISVYLVLTFALSSIFYYLIISASSIRAGGGIYVLGIMWCPGVSALITQLLFQKSPRGLGWGWGKTRYQLLSYAIPLGYAFVAYGIVWLTGLGGFHNQDFVKKMAEQLHLSGASPALVILIYVAIAATLGLIGSCVSALGEEIGWRGFLVPHLAKITTFSRTALWSGVIWSVWHYPLIIFADYNKEAPVWYSLTCFTVMVLGISFIFAWMRLKSGSLWTGMFLHASHNLFIQGVFTPLTYNTGYTNYVIDEFGSALAIVSIVAAFIVWRKRSELPDTRLVTVTNATLLAATQSEKDR